MRCLFGYSRRLISTVFAALLALIIFTVPASANPKYASIVIDAYTGTVLHERHADKKLYPASLTKMMTLYLTFEAIRDGRLNLDQKVVVSRNASRKPASKLGLKQGSTITVREAMRAAAMKSANDAATVLGDAIAGSEKDFAVLMTRRARELGMGRTTFKNASGLTSSGQKSTARDMATLSQRLFSDFPEMSKLFSRKDFRYSGRRYRSTNKLLGRYPGADGIKTGYTNASGYNLASTARQGDNRLIAIVFGGKSAARRDRHIRSLMDRGFTKLRSMNLVRAPEVSAFPRRKPVFIPANTMIANVPVAANQPAAMVRGSTQSVQHNVEAIAALRAGENPQIVMASMAQLNFVASAAQNMWENPTVEKVVVKPKPSGDWGIQVGAFRIKSYAQKSLKRAQEAEPMQFVYATPVVQTKIKGGRPMYQARFNGMGRFEAKQACKELEADGIDCFALKTGS